MSARPQPRERILDIFGAFGRRVGGWLAVADLIKLMEPFDVDEQAVRSATSRMKRSGRLLARRYGRTAGYELAPETVQLLTDGDKRIFRAVEDPALDGWLLAMFSVPESQRNRRYLIRSRLSWLGFGMLTSGVMLAPRSVRGEVNHMLQRTHLDEFVSLWEASAIGEDERELVSRGWDLETIASSYHDFIAQFTPVVRQWRVPDKLTIELAFVDYVEALSHWRQLPYMDPGLPLQLLPNDWPGAQARALFLEIVERLTEPAFQHFRSVVMASAKIASY